MAADTERRAADNYVSHLQFDRALGAYCWTLDGRRYIDLVCGQGPVILGHAHPEVTNAVTQQAQNGTLLPGRAPVFYELCDLLRSLYPQSERALTFKTGSEAVGAAVRLARAATGRQRVLRVGFHGWHDQVVSPYVRCHSYDPSTFEYSSPPGVPHDAYAELVHVWHGNNPFELSRLVLEGEHDFAAVLVDPVQLAPPHAGAASRELARAARNRGAILIFDESKTGFRVHLGGAQALYDVRADLTILSKGLANGFPLAVVLGSNELLGLAASSRVKGTFGNEAVSMAAAVATVRTLIKVDAPQVLEDTGIALLKGLNDAIRSVGQQDSISAVPYHWPCMPHVHFGGDACALKDDFFARLVAGGVLMMKDHMSYVSLALARTDVQEIADAARVALSEALASPRLGGAQRLG